MENHYKRYLSGLHTTGKYRQLPAERSTNLDFSSNDYLCLSRHPDVIQAAIDACQTYGVGSTGSRLLSGNNALIEDLEKTIAKDKKEEAALIFNTGFQTNSSVLSSLLDASVLKAKPLVFFDKYNHASLYQALSLSSAEMIRYRHNDMNHLEDLLNRYDDNLRPKFIVTETLFGMDGDTLPLADVATLAQKHNAFLYLDEAHATGIMGKHGYGLSTTLDLSGISHLVMGTFSKALGCSGGYIACSDVLKNYIMNKAPGFIYSTANSPMVIGAVAKAWSMVKDFDKERNALLSLANEVRHTLKKEGFDTGLSTSHLIPVILGSEEKALHAQAFLHHHGMNISCIRPPTVPMNTSRLRFALNINHKKEDIMGIVPLMTSIYKSIKII